MSKPMTCSIAPSGLRQYTNEDLVLLGGYRRSGSTPDGTIGAGFMVLDARQLAKGGLSSSAQLGNVELFLLRPELRLFHGLVRIEVRAELRRQGIGRRIVEAIAATAPDEQLKIHDIQQDAVPFWIRLGCIFHPRPPTWDASFRLQARRTEAATAAPATDVGFIPASRPRLDDHSPG